MLGRPYAWQGDPAREGTLPHRPDEHGRCLDCGRWRDGAVEECPTRLRRALDALTPAHRQPIPLAYCSRPTHREVLAVRLVEARVELGAALARWATTGLPADAERVADLRDEGERLAVLVHRLTPSSTARMHILRSLAQEGGPPETTSPPEMPK